MARKLTQEQKTLAFRLRRQGLTKAEIARQISCTNGLVVSMFQGKAPSTGTPSEWSPRRGALTIDDREQILLGRRSPESLSSVV